MTNTFSPAKFLLLAFAVLLCAASLWTISPAGQSMLASADAAMQVQTIYSDHPVQKRGFDKVEPIRRCIDNGGTMEAWFHPVTFRSALVCQPSNHFAVQIAKFYNSLKREITSFPKEKSRTIEAVHNYLQNRGYLRIGSPEFEAWRTANPKLFESIRSFLPPVP